MNSMPSARPWKPKSKRLMPEFTSVPASPSRRPRITMPTALMTEPRASTTAAISPHTISEKYSAGPNCSAIAASGGAASEERADRRDPERRPGASLQRHLMAVNGGDDGGGFAGDVDQDRGGRAAVLR